MMPETHKMTLSGTVMPESYSEQSDGCFESGKNGGEDRYQIRDEQL